MSVENRLLANDRYTNLVREFKLLWTVYKYFSTFVEGQGEFEALPPVDINSTYSKLTFIKRLLLAPDNPAIEIKMNEVDDELRSMRAWFYFVDERVTPFMLRTHIERTSEVDRNVLIGLVTLLFQ